MVLDGHDVSMVWIDVVVKIYDVDYKKNNVLYGCLQGLQNRCMYYVQIPSWGWRVLIRLHCFGEELSEF